MYTIRSHICFTRRITSQLQKWAFFTYLHGKPRNTYIYPKHERHNISNTSTHQEVVASLLNLHCYSHFSCLENFKCSFWKIMIFAVVMLFFWKSVMCNSHIFIQYKRNWWVNLQKIWLNFKKIWKNSRYNFWKFLDYTKVEKNYT